MRDEILAELPGAAFAGADDGAVDRLAALTAEVTGLALPSDHVEFLRLMGGGPPPVAFTYDADSTSDALARRLEIHREDGDVPPAGCVLVATDGLHVESVVIRVADGTVWSADDDLLVEPMSDLWLGLLGRRAFQVLGQQHRHVTLTATGVPGPDVLAPVRDALAALGWDPWSDSVSTCALSPDGELAVVAEQAPGKGGWLAVTGHTRRSVRALAGRLCAVAGLQPERWW